jgi:hypothetical protein
MVLINHVAQWMSHAKLHSTQQDCLFHQTLQPWGETSIKSAIFLVILQALSFIGFFYHFVKLFH